MATNEHNSSSEPILTSISGSTLALSADIDQAVLDIQNYIDTTKTNIDLSITNLGTDLGSALSGSQVNIENAISQAVIDIQASISGSTVDIDTLIDSAVTNVNNNVDSKTSLITTINNAFLGSGDSVIGIPNLNVGSKYTERRCTTSGTEETLFYFASPGYLWVQAYNDSVTTIAEVSIYRGDDSSSNNLISKTYISPGESKICACFPALCDDECYINAKSDGSSNLCVIAQLYSTNPGTLFELNVSDNSILDIAHPTTIYHSTNPLNVSTISATKVRSIVKFDLSTLPSGAIIQSAYLNFMPSYSNTGDNLHIALTSEDVVLSECTWNDRSSGVPWSVAGDGGGSLSPTPIASINTDGQAGSFVSVDVTDTIKSWINGSLTNNGFIFYLYPANGKQTTIYSYFESNATRRPKITCTLL